MEKYHLKRVCDETSIWDNKTIWTMCDSKHSCNHCTMKKFLDQAFSSVCRRHKQIPLRIPLSFPLRIPSVNVTKSKLMVTFTEEILNEKLHFLYSVEKKCREEAVLQTYWWSTESLLIHVWHDKVFTRPKCNYLVATSKDIYISFRKIYCIIVVFLLLTLNMFLFSRSQHLLVQSQQWKHQKKYVKSTQS